MSKEKPKSRGRPKAAVEYTRFHFKIRDEVAVPFKEAVNSIRPRTDYQAVVEMLMEQWLASGAALPDRGDTSD